LGVAKHIPGPLYFERQGAAGTPMLFIHSTPDDHRLWMFQTAHFSNWYRTIAVDLAGYGRSAAPQKGVRVADQAEACWEVLDTVAPETGAIIQGNSLGSFVALHMARLRPARTRALILSGCGYLPTREPMIRWKERYETEGLGLRHGQVLDHFSPAAQQQPLVQHYARMVADLSNEGTLASIIAMNAALSEPDPDSLLETVSAPTLVISGTADRNHASAFELARRIPGGRIVSIEGAGHSSNFEAPWAFDQYCIEFLAEHGLHPA
jgi:pimeloyl-ACP methyl ester carboxylesterase